MGRLILCSKREDFYNICNYSDEYFVSSSENHGGFGYLKTYSKLRIQTRNCYISKLGFAAGTGTFIYRDCKDVEALRLVLEDFDGDPNSIRNKLVGSYCLVISKNEKVYVFVDAASTYNIFYFIDEGNIIATNTYYHVAKTLPTLHIDEELYIGEWLQKTILEKTMVHEIKKLTGTVMLVYENDMWHTKEIGYPERVCATDFISKVTSKYQVFPNLFQKSSIFLTGGQDSRLSLALLLKLGIKPKVYYGVGNSSDTSTKENDKAIVDEISKKYSLEEKLMNWNDTDKKNIDSYLHKYGELFTVYCMNKNFINEFENKIETDFICFGYFGEVYRTIESIDEYKKNKFTLSDYIDDLYLTGTKRYFKNNSYQNYRKKMYDLHLIACEKKGLNPSSLTKDDFQTLNTIYRQRWDTVTNNFANIFFYSTPLFGEFELVSYAEKQPYLSKKNSRFQMQCIEKLDKEILTIPFFSHIREKRLDQDTLELLEKHSLVATYKEKIRNIVKSPMLLNCLKHIYYHFTNDLKGLQEIRAERKRKAILKKNWDTNEIPILKDKLDFDLIIDFMEMRAIKRLQLLQFLINDIEKKCLTTEQQNNRSTEQIRP